VERRNFKLKRDKGYNELCKLGGPGSETVIRSENLRVGEVLVMGLVRSRKSSALFLIAVESWLCSV